MHIHWIVNGVTGDQHSGYRSSLASNRYRAILPAEGLRRLGHDIEFVDARSWTPETYDQDTKPDAVVIGKLLPGTALGDFYGLSEHILRGAEAARSRGCAVLADINDDHFLHPQLGTHWHGVVDCAQAITVGSRSMAERVRQITSKPAYVIGDPFGAGIEEPAVFQRPTGVAGFLQNSLNRLGYMTERLELVWFGSHTNWPAMAEWASLLLPLAQEQPYSINVISAPGMGIEAFVDQYNQNHQPNALMQFTPWDEEHVWEILRESHMVLIPSDLGDGRKQVKTANRLIDALACGRFVVASPVPAYSEYCEYAWLGDEPVAGVKWAMSNPGQVLAKLRKGQERIKEAVSPDAIARAWEAALKNTLVSKFDEPAVITKPAMVGAQATVKLNLGCGDKILAGYTNVDVAQSRGGKAPDVICDLHRLETFLDNSVDEILAVHVVEHFWRWEVVDILREWVRVLKPGGKMILECPNLISACEEFLADSEMKSMPDQRGQRTMWVFYGDPSWHDPLMVHRWGYTPKSLATVMFESGLTDVRQEPAQYKLREPRDMRLVGVKPSY